MAMVCDKWTPSTLHEKCKRCGWNRAQHDLAQRLREDRNARPAQYFPISEKDAKCERCAYRTRWLYWHGKARLCSACWTVAATEAAQSRGLRRLDLTTKRLVK